MNKNWEDCLRKSPRPYLTEAELAALLEGTADSRYGRVKRLLSQRKLLHIRRGLYCISEKGGCQTKPHPYEIAQYIYGPSCASLESAFSFHGLIPERVTTVTSVTLKRSKMFETPLGVFDYLHLPAGDFYTEVDLVKEDGHSFLMARPWRAICDYIFCYKKDWKGLRHFSDSLRMNCLMLPELQQETIQLLDEYYHHSRVSRFLKSILS